VIAISGEINPGRVVNPEKEQVRNLDMFFAGKLAPLPQKRARVAVADLVSSFRFEGVFKGEMKGAVPVGVLPPKRVAEIGSKTRVVLFSDYTSAKGAKKHKDIGQDDYLLVQLLMEQGDYTEDKENHLTFIGTDDNGKHWKAVVKKTRDGKQLYLQTLHRYKKKQADKKIGKS